MSLYEHPGNYTAVSRRQQQNPATAHLYNRSVESFSHLQLLPPSASPNTVHALRTAPASRAGSREPQPRPADAVVLNPGAVVRPRFVLPVHRRRFKTHTQKMATSLRSGHGVARACWTLGARLQRALTKQTRRCPVFFNRKKQLEPVHEPSLIPF